MHSITSLQQELEDRRQLFGTNHYSVAETLNVIGIMHHHITDDQVKAITHHQEALNILISQQYKTQEMLFDIATTIIDIGNCHWKKGDRVQANKMWCKALRCLNRCFSHQSHPKTRMFQQSIQNKMEHINDPYTHTIVTANMKRSKSPLDSDVNLLTRLSSEDLLSQENDFPKLKRQTSFSLSTRSFFRSGSKLHITHANDTFGNAPAC